MRQPLAKNDRVVPLRPMKERFGDDYQRRLRLTGLIKGDKRDDEVPRDIDVFRMQLARRIAMAVNAWHGCPQAICRRVRGCMAPRVRCSNAEPLPPDPTGERTARVTAEVRRALDEAIARKEQEKT